MYFIYSQYGMKKVMIVKWLWSHDLDCRHAQNLKKSSSPELLGQLPWYVASGSVVLRCLYKSLPLVDLDLFSSMVSLGPLGIEWEIQEKLFYYMLLYSRVWKRSEIEISCPYEKKKPTKTTSIW